MIVIVTVVVVVVVVVVVLAVFTLYEFCRRFFECFCPAKTNIARPTLSRRGYCPLELDKHARAEGMGRAEIEP